MDTETFGALLGLMVDLILLVPISWFAYRYYRKLTAWKRPQVVATRDELRAPRMEGLFFK